MQINVAQLLKSPIGTTRSYDIDEDIRLDDSEPRRVAGEVELTRTHRGVLARTRLNAVLMLNCSRCLAVFEYPVMVEFEEEYVPAIDIASGVALPAPEDSSLFVIDEHHILDLREAVRQNLLLAVPMKPLCRDLCEGICPGCGQNLNTGACRCAREGIDPRWSGLTQP
ncbi:MAG: DUF177 domain-containing protein [Chloroflexi bacterium]|nr:DUF177 domain-containing protein [Chloroflexota bacterium]